MSTAAPDVYCLLMPLQGLRLLLPNAAIQEVMAFTPPMVGREDASPWLLGEMHWKGERIALISVEGLCGAPVPERGSKSRIAILHAMGARDRIRHMAVLLQGHPQLVRIQRGVLESLPAEQGDQERPILSRVRIGTAQAVIPDPEALERLVDRSGISASEPAQSDG